MKLNFQSPPGQPGSFPLPNSGEPGESFAQSADKAHPAARRAYQGGQRPAGQTTAAGTPAAPVAK